MKNLKMEDVLFLDFETTGLNPQVDRPLEFGCVFLTCTMPLSFPVLWRDWSTERSMPQRVQAMHTKSGLLDDLSSASHTLQDIEHIVINGLKARGYSRGQVQIAGFSIAFDRGYLKEWMPDLDSFLHYRMVDVTSILEFLSFDPKFTPAGSDAEHRALADCYAARREFMRCAEHVGIDFGGKLEELKAMWTPPVGRPLDFPTKRSELKPLAPGERELDLVDVPTGQE